MAQRIRIVHVISSLELGGAQAVLSDLIRMLPADTYEQYVIYFHGGPYVDRLQKFGVPLYQIRGALCTYDPLFWWRVFCLIRTINPAVIHASLWSAGFVCRSVGALLGIPVVTAVHALLQHHGWLRSALDRMTARAGDTFIAVSPEVAASVTAWLPQQLVHVVPNGIDIEHIQMIQKTNGSYAIPALLPEHFVIGSVGRFVPVKRYDLLVHLFAQLSRRYDHVRLLLIGVGSLENALRAQAIALGVADRVFFIVGQSALPLYPRMNCFVQTSLYEGLSIALLEAMSTGLACITTGHDGQHAIIKHGVNGYIVPPDDMNQVIHYIEQLVRSPMRRAAMGCQAADTVRQGYSIQAMKRGYEAVLVGVAKTVDKDNFLKI